MRLVTRSSCTASAGYFLSYSRMNIMNKSALALALSLGLFVANGAQAQLLDASAGVRLDSGTGSASSGMPILGATTTVDAGMGADIGHTTAATTSGSAAASATLGFDLDRKQVESAEYSVNDAADVHTAAALEAYAGSSVKDDERLESAALENNELTVRYKTDAKFLGFIPASIMVTATVDAEGNATVRYPWYAFLMPTYESRAELEARIEKEQSAIRDELAETAVAGGGEASVEARQWALMLERLRSSLYAGASAEARS